MSLKQVRTLALAATLLAGTTALAYAQSSSSSMGTGGSSAKHGDSSSTLGTGASSTTSGKHGEGAASTMGAGGSSGSSGDIKKGDEGKSSTMKHESGKGAAKKGETGKAESSKSAEKANSATSGHGKSAAESGKNGANANSANSTMGKSGQSGTTGKGANASSASSSSANASANVNLTTQQKTVIKNTVIDNKSAPRVSHVDFNVSVGTVIPTTVHYAPLPASIVEIHPAWRGYDYFVYNDEVIIIQPDSRKIVEIIVLS
jgi:hypothetical protein